MSSASLIRPEDVPVDSSRVIIDCRFSLADTSEGRALYHRGHIPGASYVDMAVDLSGDIQEHGGRHPLPHPDQFLELLAALGIGPNTPVIAYDDSRLAFASRFWWMMRSLGFTPPALINGGYSSWCALGLETEKTIVERPPCARETSRQYENLRDINGVREAQGRGALLIDSREQRRYEGLEEPMDPVAGHVPGAINKPWQGVTAADGQVLSIAQQRAHWGDAIEEQELLVYCGSGVTACVNLFSLALLGRDDACLYGGSWSDWCSYL
jgi:thiosulfate/3-mercaptopyruvate sulfurtransferase